MPQTHKGCCNAGLWEEKKKSVLTQFHNGFCKDQYTDLKGQAVKHSRQCGPLSVSGSVTSASPFQTVKTTRPTSGVFSHNGHWGALSGRWSVFRRLVSAPLSDEPVECERFRVSLSHACAHLQAG